MLASNNDKLTNVKERIKELRLLNNAYFVRCSIRLLFLFFRFVV